MVDHDDLTIDDMSPTEYRTVALIISVICLAIGALVGIMLWV